MIKLFVFTYLFDSHLLDSSTNTGTWVLEKGGLGFSPSRVLPV